MTDIDLAAIRARAEAATEGPWYWRNTMDVLLLGARSKLVMGFRRFGMNGAQPEFRNSDNLMEPAGKANIYDYPDAEFIAHAREDVPALLALVEQQQAALDAARRLVEDWQANGNSRELGDPTDRTWHECTRQLLRALDGVSGDE